MITEKFIICVRCWKIWTRITPRHHTKWHVHFREATFGHDLCLRSNACDLMKFSNCFTNLQYCSGRQPNFNRSTLGEHKDYWAREVTGLVNASYLLFDLCLHTDLQQKTVLPSTSRRCLLSQIAPWRQLTLFFILQFYAYKHHFSYSQ